jgi:hypothetical protein
MPSREGGNGKVGRGKDLATVVTYQHNQGREGTVEEEEEELERAKKNAEHDGLVALLQPRDHGYH